MKVFKTSYPSLLLTPHGFYLWNGYWSPLSQLKDCPKDVNLFIDGFPMSCQSYKLPPTNLLKAHQILRQRVHMESHAKNTFGWGMVCVSDSHKIMNTAFPFDNFQWPDFNAFDIWVHQCHWLPFAYLCLIQSFQEQQPCGGIIVLSKSLKKEYQLCFIQGHMIKMIRPLLDNQDPEQALQETLHYCLNEYGMDPADIKTLNLTDYSIEGAYHLSHLYLSDHHSHGIENTLFKSFQNKPFYEKWSYTWHAPQNYSRSLTIKPIVYGLKGMALSLTAGLVLNGWSTFEYYQEIEKVKAHIKAGQQLQNNLLSQLALTNPLPWELLHSIARENPKSTALEKLKELSPLAEQNILLREFLWTKEIETANIPNGLGIEKLKLRFATQGLEEEGEEISQTHQIVFDYLQNLWGSKVQIEQHNNRLEVVF